MKKKKKKGSHTSIEAVLTFELSLHGAQHYSHHTRVSQPDFKDTFLRWRHGLTKKLLKMIFLPAFTHVVLHTRSSLDLDTEVMTTKWVFPSSLQQ